MSRSAIPRREFLGQVGGLALASAASMSAGATPRDATPRDATPRDATPRDGAARDGAARSIASDKVLFIDEAFIVNSQGTRLKLHPPRKTGERLIESDQPWESATLNWFSVLFDGQRYRLWYECYDVEGWPTADDTSFCYAESADGITWTKPNLGLVSYQGNTNNNILFRQIGEGDHRSRVHGSGVFFDPAAPPEERFKCVSQGLFQGIADRPYFVAGMTSRDGLHWTRHPRPICPVFADSQYSGFWDPRRERYMLYGRVSGHGGRAVGQAESERFDSFAPFQGVLETDDTDPPDSDLYNPACQLYPGAADVYLMFPSLFHHARDTLDIRLATSRDGIHWTRPDHDTPWISLGEPTDFDGASLYMANGACQPTGDELSFYFSGSALKHEETDLDRLREPRHRRVISRAVARPDRMVSVSVENSPARFDTPLLRFAGERLVLNAIARQGGSVRVGLLDALGREIAGRALVDCQPLAADAAAWTVTWRGEQGLAAWSGQAIQLRFELTDADLFGFQFVESA